MVFINILSCCRYHIIHLQLVEAVQASPHCLYQSYYHDVNGRTDLT